MEMRLDDGVMQLKLKIKFLIFNKNREFKKKITRLLFLSRFRYREI